MARTAAETYRLAHERVMSGELVEACQYLQNLMRLEPENLDYLVEYATFLAQVTCFDEIREIEERVRQAAPGSAEQFYIQALQLEFTDAEAQLALVNRALELNPDFPHALWLRANLLKHQGLLDQAVADLDRCLALEPDYFLAHSEAGLIKGQLQHYEAALEHLIRYLHSPFARKGAWLYRAIAICGWGLAHQVEIRLQRNLDAQLSLDLQV